MKQIYLTFTLLCALALVGLCVVNCADRSLDKVLLAPALLCLFGAVFGYLAYDSSRL